MAHDCSEGILMSQVTDHLRIGQFSESPVLAAAQKLGLDAEFGVTWSTEKVVSSPGQFKSLDAGDIDIAITSPDNVMLYATTDKNPLTTQIPITLLRPIDHGLGLTFFTRPEVNSVAIIQESTLGVDVLKSGFAFLLFRLIDHVGADVEKISFTEIGATPKRAQMILDGQVAGSILNAESAVLAKESGLHAWATSADLYPDYLGTVLATRSNAITPAVERLVAMWTETTKALLAMSAEEVSAVMSDASPALATPQYVEILQSPVFGLIDRDTVQLSDLETLREIRSAAGAYTPSDQDLQNLVSRA